MSLSGRGSCDPIQHNVAWAKTYLHTKWQLDPFSRLATIDMGQKLGGGCALFFWGELGPHRTQLPGREWDLPMFRVDWHKLACHRLSEADRFCGTDYKFLQSVCSIGTSSLEWDECYIFYWTWIDSDLGRPYATKFAKCKFKKYVCRQHNAHSKQEETCIHFHKFVLDFTSLTFV